MCFISDLILTKSKQLIFVVFRVWDISKDLTISGNLGVSPYLDVGNGRPNLEVDI